MNTKLHIFLKPGTTILVGGTELNDRACILSSQPVSIIRNVLGDSVSQVINDRDFDAQAHAHRFDRYTYLPTLTDDCKVEVFEIELSPAEQRVHDLIVLGLSQQAIADRLFISLQTVKFHTTAIRVKKRVHATREIIALHYIGRDKFMEARQAA